MTVVRGPAKTIGDLAPPGSTIIRGHGSLVMTVRVGDVWTFDGEVLGRVAATEYDHGRRELLAAVVPELLYWHLKLQFEMKLEGYGEFDAPLTLMRVFVHDPPVAWRGGGVGFFDGTSMVNCPELRSAPLDELPAEVPVLDSEPGRLQR